MNIKSITRKVAVIAFAATAAMNAQSAELTGTVPVDFQIGNKTFVSGDYSIAQRSNGNVAINNENHVTVAFASVPVQTEVANRANRNMLTFKRSGNSYKLAGYCVAGSGCWATQDSLKSNDGKVEIALNRK